jgi:DNA-binding winged helix-turn-helix (wHTH) protein
MQEVPQSALVFRFGVIEVDLAAGELRKQGSKIRLQEQPFRILIMLLARAGEVVSRDEIYRDLWAADTFVDFDQGVGTAIKKLRQALHDDAETPRYIETLPKRGSRFIAAVEKPSSPGVAQRIQRPPNLMRQRKTIVDHPLRTIKPMTWRDSSGRGADHTAPRVSTISIAVSQAGSLSYCSSPLRLWIYHLDSFGSLRHYRVA